MSEPNFSVRRVDGLFRCDWSTDVVYEPIYPESGMVCDGSFLSLVPHLSIQVSPVTKIRST